LIDKGEDADIGSNLERYSKNLQGSGTEQESVLTNEEEEFATEFTRALNDTEIPGQDKALRMTEVVEPDTCEIMRLRLHKGDDGMEMKAIDIIWIQTQLTGSIPPVICDMNSDTQIVCDRFVQVHHSQIRHIRQQPGTIMSVLQTPVPFLCSTS
jgi:hypothetical protein